MLGIGAAQTNIKAVISAEDNASKVLRGFGDNVGGLGHTIEKALKTAAVATAAVGVAAIAFGVASVKAFTESQDMIAQTNAVLKSTGGIAGVTASEVTKLAIALQKSTKFSDEEVRSAENLLLTFTAIGKDIFPQATKTVLNMATALGEDTKSASIQLGKALQDPILGITALRRVGVNFNDAQKQVIQNLVETGHKAEAQKLILKELEVEFGGSAEAAGGTFAGSLKKLKNSFNDIQESIGATIVKALQPLMERLQNFVNSDKFQAWLVRANEWLAVHIPQAIDYLTKTVIPALKDIFEQLWPQIQIVLGWLKDIFNFIRDNTWILWAFVGVLAAIKVALFLEGAVQAFQGAMIAVRGAYVATQLILSVPIVVPALIITSALASIYQIASTYFAVKNQIESKQNEAYSVLKDIAAKHPEKKGEINQQLKSMGLKPLARGGQALSGNPYLVGEEGAELFVPSQSGRIIPNNKIGSGNNGTVNVIVNVGLYAGSEQEKRKVAMELLKSLQDIAGSKSTTVSQMLGA